MKLVCYCCGEKVDTDFALVINSDGTKNQRADRCFIMKREHAIRADGTNVVVVKKLTMLRLRGTR